MENKADQYFTQNPTSKSEEREIEYCILDKRIKFIVDNGVFSKAHVDIATNFMLNVLIKEKIHGDVLDLGCGYGTIGITLKKFFENIKVTMLDINERAIGLANKNVKINGLKDIVIKESDGFDIIKEDEKFDFVVTNPPIRAGKKVIYKMYEDSFNHLKKGGALYLVINKKHGAPSTKEFLTSLFGNCEVLDKKTGFNVIKCVKE
ncbi:MAG: class I SAM-dependent methyltransferase [Clostridia bacterium]|nr:class I SAM-dependent methyltransferase [Clostridia bacterium]